jgi:glycosyltransferase involved in cell wall biosynthesis
LRKTSIVILTGNHLCHNPRVIKEATALAAAGFEVEVLGAWISAELKARDLELLTNLPFQFTPVLDVTQDKWTWMKCRAFGKAARMFHQRTGIETRWQLGYTVGALARAARQRKADLFIAHSEPALWALSALRSLSPVLRLGVDMEDWFSEDLMPEARRQRPAKLLRSLEERALKHGAHSTCTSQAMSKALAKEYGCRPPVVIYNAFPWADRQKLDGQFKDRRDLRVPSLHWYSQTLGHGRGLEELFAALPHVTHPMEIHLRGQAVSGFHEWLAVRLPENWRPCVFVHDLVANDELLSRIAEHDIGFAGEQKYCRNKELTVSNKILHYLLGGLAVVASDTAGQREIAAQADGAVRLYLSGDSQALARELNALLNSREKLQAAKAAALQAAEKTFCWERQVPGLLQSVENALLK